MFPERRRKQAELRAQELLLSLLTQRQEDYLIADGYIPVTSNTGNEWKIYTDSYSNNLRKRNGNFWDTYCANIAALSWNYNHRVVTAPRSDHHVAQLLMLQTNEKALHAVAFPSEDYRRIIRLEQEQRRRAYLTRPRLGRPSQEQIAAANRQGNILLPYWDAFIDRSRRR